MVARDARVVGCVAVTGIVGNMQICDDDSVEVF